MSAQNPAPSRRRVVARVLIVDPSDGGILIRDDNAGELPSLRVADRFYPEVEELVEAARRDWGVEIATLRCLSTGDEDGSPRIYSAVLFGEAREPRPWPPMDAARRMGGEVRLPRKPAGRKYPP